MSRAHERAYRLLAERVRLGTSARRALYATIAALIGSGVWWLGVHYAATLFAVTSDDFSRLAQEALALKVHGGTAFATLFALGAMSVYHVRRGWALKRNRVMGSVLVAEFALLVATGYALYYLVGDSTHGTVSVLHWALGLALAPMLIVHIVNGRRSRGPAFDVGAEPPSRHRDEPSGRRVSRCTIALLRKRTESLRIVGADAHSTRGLSGDGLFLHAGGGVGGTRCRNG
jgi:hypothetical protein